MRNGRRAFCVLTIVLLSIAAAAITAAAGDLLVPVRKTPVDTTRDNRVKYECLSSMLHQPPNDPVNGLLGRKSRWSLPAASAAPADTTIRCLVLRYNFQYETVDDPNTTGRGHMLVDPVPLETAADTAAYLDSVGHLIDHPPHDSAYFHAHMRALDLYYQFVSQGAVTLEWDIFPRGDTSTYQLPEPMNTYGRCTDSLSVIVAGLERYFVDCIRLADQDPDINFSQYDAIFLFHAGSDRQNDIGFPPTCSDLFTGWIRFGGDSVVVDGGTDTIKTALLMPETASQDNRATALNAVMAHEFGHQLGLVDLYSTLTFLSQLGDFALMDNNGFGTGVDFGFPAGNVFGAIPVYPMAWSRAYLGFNQVEDFRQGSDIRIAAAEIQSSGRKIARVPISEKEYYLIENRVVDWVPDPGDIQPVRIDSTSGVILGPADRTKQFTGEYDALCPGTGMLIFIVDEEVAGWPAIGGGASPQYPDQVATRFEANQLQWEADRRFIRLIEADGLVNFGGFYRAGYGSPDDMFRDDRATSFTPNTNPPTLDNTGNNSHIFITNITRDSISAGYVDTVMFFDVETDKMASGFPVRCGLPSIPLNPIAADLNNDGTDEIIAASGNRLFAFTTEGDNFIHSITPCIPVVYVDTAVATVNGGIVYPVPLYAQFGGEVTAGPVTGDFGGDTTYVAVGLNRSSANVLLLQPDDADCNGQADLWASINADGIPIAISFGKRLYILTDAGTIHIADSAADFNTTRQVRFPDKIYHGISRVGESLVLLAGDSASTVLELIQDTSAVYEFRLDYRYELGPITVDVNRDGDPEIAAFSRDGHGVLVSIDTTVSPPTFEVLAETSVDTSLETNPVAADLDGDGYPEIVVGGVNQVFAFTRDLVRVTGYPFEVNDKYPADRIIAAPVVADIEDGGMPETIFPSDVGNMYSFGDRRTFGFPLSAGEKGAGSPLVFHDSTGGYLGYLGADGWFYGWEMAADTSENYWPMGGQDPEGSFAFPADKLSEPVEFSSDFDDDRFYNYPNPVVSGETTFRYFLGQPVNSVKLTIYDLNGQEVAALDGTTSGGTDNEVVWNCSDITPGVYRCIIRVDGSGGTQTAFTDVAVIR